MPPVSECSGTRSDYAPKRHMGLSEIYISIEESTSVMSKAFVMIKSEKILF